MGLDVPDLDDREFEAFLEDARSRISVHSDAWTDHNAHDPGITFLELFAWIAETDDYRLDRLTDDHVEQYLRLVDIRPHPPRRATARLAVDVPDALDGAQVREGEPLLAVVGPESVERFRVRGETQVTSATVDTVVSVHRAGRSDVTVANDSAEMSYRAFGDTPAAGDALYLGFRSDPFAAASRFELDVEYHEADLPDPASHGDERVTFEPSHRIVWEYYVPSTDEDEEDARWFDDERWRVFESTAGAVRDETRHLYEGGRVSLPAPDDWPDAPVAFFDRDDAHYWVRGRLARRDPPAPSPACDAPEQPAAAPEVHYEIPPVLSAVRTNVVSVEHASAATDVDVDCEDPDRPATLTLERREGPKTTARPGQRFHFDRAPVQSATVSVGGREWREVPDFAGSDPDDRDYVLNRDEGVVRFGDGVQGTVPEPGQAVVAIDCEFGGGADGNVPASTEWRFECEPLGDAAVVPLGGATGGADAESVESALVRAKEARRTPFRTVTPSDYGYVATHTPGLRFGRAAVLTGGEERDPTDPIRVVVIPFSPPDVRPVPSEGFLDAVDCHLSRHALLTDNVTAVAPTYVSVTVEADIQVVDGTVPADRRRAGADAIREFLDPLRGFDGDGWLFGRPVYPSEIYELLEETDGIETVVDVSVETAGDDLAENETALPALEDVAVRVIDEPEDCGRGF